MVQDNGRGLSSRSSSGLGSQVLDETAFPWSLQSQPSGGTILKAQIAVAAKKRPAKTK
jgi:hypothetical protein